MVKLKSHKIYFSHTELNPYDFAQISEISGCRNIYEFRKSSGLPTENNVQELF